MRKETLKILTISLGILLSGCMKESMVSGFSDDRIPISFGCESEGLTKSTITGEVAARDLGNNFIVTGYAKTSDNTSMVFDHYNINYKSGTSNSTVSNTKGWEYVGQTPSSLSQATTQEIKYWDKNADYYFVAFSKGEGNATFSRVDNENIGSYNTSPSQSNSVFEISGSIYDIEGAYYSDLVLVDDESEMRAAVKPHFRHMGAKLRLALYESIPGYSVCDVKFYRSDNEQAQDGTELYPTIYQSVDRFPSDNSEMTVYVAYPYLRNNGAAYVSTPNVSNRSSYLAFNCGIQLFTKENKENVADTVFIGRSSAGASYSVLAIDIPALSDPSPLPISLKVDYTLVPTDGAGERIYVHGAKASVPAAFTQWASNCMYTYMFRISDNTSGTTGGNVEGLYPISFEAMSVSGFDGSRPETMCEPESPILAYQKGGPLTSGDDVVYMDGNIYAVVYDNDVNVELATGSNGNIALFKAVPSGSAVAGDITAGVVADCFAAGSGNYQFAAGKYVTLTRVADSSLQPVNSIPQEDSNTGSQLNVNAARFNAEQGAVYVLQYKDTQGRYYYKVMRTLYYIHYKAYQYDIYDRSVDYFGLFGEDGNIEAFEACFLDTDGNELELLEQLSRAASSVPDTYGYISGTLIFDRPVGGITALMFDYTSLTDITLPDTLKVIDDGYYLEGVFSNSCLTSLVLPASVEKVGNSAFAYWDEEDCLLTALICLGDKPPKVGSIWGYMSGPLPIYEGLTIYVPDGAIGDYRTEWAGVVNDPDNDILGFSQCMDAELIAKYPEIFQ